VEVSPAWPDGLYAPKVAYFAIFGGGRATRRLPCAEEWAAGSGHCWSGRNGTAWTAQPVFPVPSGSVSDTVLGVACTSATACTAVGYSQGSASASTKPTLAEVWNGTAWSIQDTPNPAASNNELGAVSCVTAGPCVAVGSAPDPGGYSATLVEAAG
jgi:hypothetical protein